MSFSDILMMMAPALAMCLVLVGIHSYLGLHVIKRKVIFIDLALAQIAALGTLVAYLFGIMPHTLAAYWFSLGLTAMAAGIFAMTRLQRSRIPQEAIIGLVYAIAAAMAILLIDKAPHGAEHLKDIMTGHILLIGWKAVGTAAVVYSIVGVFHFIFRHRFIQISEDPEAAWEAGVNVRLWEFLFYLSFGAVITLSVSSAGVLIVFVFLVAPAILTEMLTTSWRRQLLIGWVVGVLVSVVGLTMSYVADLPTGPAVIGTYGAVLLTVAAVRYVLAHNSAVLALRNILLVLLAFGAGFAVLVQTGKWLKPAVQHEAVVHREAARLPGEREDALKNLDTASFEEQLTASESIEELEALYERVEDPDCLAPLVVRALDLDAKRGATLALRYLQTEPPAFFCADVIAKLDAMMGSPTGYDPDEDWSSEKNRKAVALMQAHFGVELKLE
ncbi:MAG: iron chelate uptake ABC transporter family permease subunit [Myxococcota bacterium]|jgi:zinc/manganese transport system permease protein|nr:iron chelate uptake ABC transporter family permease subunit [Myxococcota bacterium]